MPCISFFKRFSMAYHFFCRAFYKHYWQNSGVVLQPTLSSSRDGIYVLYHSHTSLISRLSLFKCLNVLFIDYISQSLVFCACSHTRMLLTGALGIKYLSDIFLDGVKISPSLWYVLDQKDKWNIPYTLGIQPYCFKKKLISFINRICI